MEARETMISDKRIEEINSGLTGCSSSLGLFRGRAIAHVQCEVSFQAGRQEMIQEVVEYFARNYNKELYSAGLFQVVMTSKEWQDQLRKWGIA